MVSGIAHVLYAESREELVVWLRSLAGRVCHAHGWPRLVPTRESRAELRGPFSRQRGVQKAASSSSLWLVLIEQSLRLDMYASALSQRPVHRFKLEDARAIEAAEPAQRASTDDATSAREAWPLTLHTDEHSWRFDFASRRARDEWTETLLSLCPALDPVPTSEAEASAEEERARGESIDRAYRAAAEAASKALAEEEEKARAKAKAEAEETASIAAEELLKAAGLKAEAAATTMARHCRGWLARRRLAAEAKAKAEAKEETASIAAEELLKAAGLKAEAAATTMARHCRGWLARRRLAAEAKAKAEAKEETASIAAEELLKAAGLKAEAAATMMARHCRGWLTRGRRPMRPTGLLRVHVRKASGLKNSELLGKSDPYCVVKVASRWRGEATARTVTIKNDLNPVWRQTLVLRCALDTSSTLQLRVLDEDIGRDDVLGTANLPVDLAGLVQRLEASEGWHELGADRGRVHVTVRYKPLTAEAAAVEVERVCRGWLTRRRRPMRPTGLLRVHVRKASGLKNSELLGKSDPYCVVKVASRWRGEATARTVTIKNDLNPVWRQTLVLRCALDTSSTLQLRVLDEDIGRDDVLGTAELPVDLAGLVQRLEASEGWHDLQSTRTPGKNGFGRVHVAVQFLLADSEDGKAALAAASEHAATMPSPVRAARSRSASHSSAGVSRDGTDLLDAAQYTGWLHKKGEVNTAFKRRFFVLSGTTLTWHESPKSAAKGSLDVSGASAVPSTQAAPSLATATAARHRFDLVPASPAASTSADGRASRSGMGRLPLLRGSKSQGTTSRTLVLEADSSIERDEWISALTHAAASGVREAAEAVPAPARRLSQAERVAEVADLSFLAGAGAVC